MPASQATIDRLLAGFRAFRAHYFDHRPEQFEALKKTQKPEVMFIACSDSRVDPALLTRSEPGEMFVVRNVANIVPPYEPDEHYHGTSAALEFAVRSLGVGHVIILGHSQCGGIKGLIDGIADGPEQSFIGPWMSIVRSACTHHRQPSSAGGDPARAVEQAAIRISMANLMTYPWLRDRVDQKNLRLHGWWFDLEVGKLWAYSPASEQFAPHS